MAGSRAARSLLFAHWFSSLLARARDPSHKTGLWRARAPMSAFWVGARLGPRKLASHNFKEAQLARGRRPRKFLFLKLCVNIFDSFIDESAVPKNDIKPSLYPATFRSLMEKAGKDGVGWDGKEGQVSSPFNVFSKLTSRYMYRVAIFWCMNYVSNCMLQPKTTDYL